MGKRKLLSTVILFLCSFILVDAGEVPTVYIDKNGVMRWSDTRQEASFFGVNYTVPFAHAYRALQTIGKDHKEAIDRDVYHFARLGFNAYRIHIWDVEISDQNGHLLENEHLDLLDYLIYQLRERGMRVLITTMTNFGNGYPEKNIHTGAFSYLYDKCKVHCDPNAIAAQQVYVKELINHLNPYTNESYNNDPYIIGIEINNEPCHADSPAQTEAYIRSMVEALKKAGNSKPVFYNVSHNKEHVQAYFNAPVQGTTYQWYPVGLVAGHMRKGNFLPYVSQYEIPFSGVKGFDKKAKAVYEYDPADNMYAHIHPAMVRTFRSKGFQWITQFAYDPIDMARFNTEYQTHYLNLAYTPNKAVSLAIAAEAAYRIPRNKQFPKYPNDTVFEPFRVSYSQDLSELNAQDKFYYSNDTDTKPVAPGLLKKIIGCGNSPLVQYEGTGVYFLDRLEEGVWRLEVMPDAVQVRDPFEKASLKKEVVTIAWNTWPMQVRLDDLGDGFTVKAFNEGNRHTTPTQGRSFNIRPGVYLLQKGQLKPRKQWDKELVYEQIRLGEYVAPEAHADCFSFVHQPDKSIEAGADLRVQARIVGPVLPDSVILYTDKISFWSENNPYVLMKRKQGYTYEAYIPHTLAGEGTFRYQVVVASKGKYYTYPAGVEGHPLDWDFYHNHYWTTKTVHPENRIDLLTAGDGYEGWEVHGIPESSYGLNSIKDGTLTSRFVIRDSVARFYWRKHIRDEIMNREGKLSKAGWLCLKLIGIKKIERLKVGFVTRSGFSYTAPLVVDKEDGKIYRIGFEQLKQDVTALVPAPYPTFLESYFVPDCLIPFRQEDIEILEVATAHDLSFDSTLGIESIWIE